MKRNWMIRSAIDRIRVEPMTIMTGMPTTPPVDIMIPGLHLDNAWRLIQEHYDLSPSELQKVKDYCVQLRGENNHE